MERYLFGDQEVEVIELVEDVEAFFQATTLIASWTGTCEIVGNSETDEVKGLFVGNMEGPVLAVFGDYVIRDQQGTVSVYKPELFKRYFKKKT